MKMICWIRSDFRFGDNAMFAKAAELLTPGDEVEFVFWLNPDYIGEYEARQSYFFQAFEHFCRRSEANGMPIRVISGKEDEFLEGISGADLLLFNAEYVEPFKSRDDAIIRKTSAKTERLLDRHLLHPHAVKKKDGSYYKVFTPYKKAFLQMEIESVRQVDLDKLKRHYRSTDGADVGRYFEQARTQDYEAGEETALKRLDEFVKRHLEQYDEERDFPAVDGTSRLSRYLRTGEIGIRTVYERIRQVEGKGSDVFLTELIWREFYQMILVQYPESKNQAVQREYRAISWEEDEKAFEAWCEGKTGFPIVDAAMRQLNLTGWMHNRLRMITASFLAKDLLIDWRKGERYFQRKLIDYEAASNIGGWQWAASVGTDAVPYFRVFNPTTQSKRFDPSGDFIRQFVPELAELDKKRIHDPSLADRERCGYPEQIVDHALARDRAIARFKE